MKPVCAIPSLPMARLHAERSRLPAAPTRPTSNAAGAQRSRGVSGRRGQRLPRPLARHVRARRTRRYSARQGATAPPPAQPAATRHGHATTLSKRLRTAAHLLGANLGTRIITIHWGGFDTHTNQLAARTSSSRSSRARSARSRPTSKARGIDQRVATLVFSEFGRRVKETPERRGRQGRGHRPRRGRPDAGDGHAASRAASRPTGRAATRQPTCVPARTTPARATCKVPTDFRSVYMAVIEEWLGGDDPEA